MDEIDAISSDIALMRKELGDLSRFLMDDSVSNRHAAWRSDVYPFGEQILRLRQVRDILVRERAFLRRDKEFLEQTLH